MENTENSKELSGVATDTQPADAGEKEPQMFLATEVYSDTGAMSLSFKLEIFEGPLELLLNLIAKNKVNIYDIPIFVIFEQYMDYIHRMEMFNMEVASSFIVFAAELMLIKSRMLLPPKEDQEDPRKELVDLLLEYQKAKKTAEVLHNRELTYATSYEKPPEKIELEPEYTLTHEISILKEAYERVYRRRLEFDEAQGSPDALGNLITATRIITVNEKIVHVLKKLIRTKKCLLTNLFEDVSSRNEAVATFLALLELIKGKRICVNYHSEDYSDCSIELVREKAS